jgi:hypothetical protein
MKFWIVERTVAVAVTETRKQARKVAVALRATMPEQEVGRTIAIRIRKVMVPRD